MNQAELEAKILAVKMRGGVTCVYCRKHHYAEPFRKCLDGLVDVIIEALGGNKSMRYDASAPVRGWESGGILIIEPKNVAGLQVINERAEAKVLLGLPPKEAADAWIARHGDEYRGIQLYQQALNRGEFEIRLTGDNIYEVEAAGQVVQADLKARGPNASGVGLTDFIWGAFSDGKTGYSTWSMTTVKIVRLHPDYLILSSEYQERVVTGLKKFFGGDAGPGSIVEVATRDMSWQFRSKHQDRQRLVEFARSTPLLGMPANGDHSLYGFRDVMQRKLHALLPLYEQNRVEELERIKKAWEAWLVEAKRDLEAVEQRIFEYARNLSTDDVLKSHGGSLGPPQ